MKAFKGKVALVTGASSGVGKAIAEALIASGARVCVVGRRKEALRTLKPARSYVADLYVDNAASQIASAIKTDFGALDILVHSAGVHETGKIESSSLSKLDEQYRLNLRTPFALTQSLLALLRASRGQVVFINSSVALSGKANVTQYAATKSALRAFANGLRDEVNSDGIRVLTLFLGRTATPMQAEIYKQEGGQYRPEVLLQPEDISSVVVHTLGLPRTAEVTEIHMRPAIKSY